VLDGTYAERIPGERDLARACRVHVLAANKAVAALVDRVRRGQVTAAFCITDHVAIEALRALRQAGLRVPGDVSLVGLDGVPRTEDFELTTVEQPMEAVGAKAVELLLDEIEGRRSAPAQVRLAPRLVVRGSMAGPPRR